MELKRPVVVRMAPSPTGDAHVGHARTALYNYLFARQNNGTFIMRIDDTDTKRHVDDAEEGVLRALRWLGLDWDEGPDKPGPRGPYRQSERLDIYRQHVQQLLDEGKAYECFCSEEELAAERAQQQAARQDIKYSGRCRSLTRDEREQFRAEGRVPTVRLITPGEGVVGFHDLVRGWIQVEAAHIGDFVILKSNGIPVYNFATVVDDHLMGISQVTRAAEHIANTPSQVLIYQALGWEVPQFAHFSIMLNEDRSKMSKRMGATFVGEYANMGYLPEAMLNFLAFLGWSPKGEVEDEILSLDELLEKFSLGDCSISNAVFDIKKLDWINAKWIRRLSAAELAERMLPFLQKAGLVDGEVESSWLITLAKLVHERLNRLDEAPQWLHYFFQEPELPLADLVTTLKKQDAKQAGLEKIHAALQASDWTEAGLEQALLQVQQEIGWSNRELFMGLRLIISGGKVSPPIYPTLEALGREKTLARIQRAIAAV